MESIEIEERSDIIIGGKAGFSMAVHEGMGKLIVSRKQEGNTVSDDIIEQYNVFPGWVIVLEKIICPRNGGIESVAFVGQNIVASHLNGSITISHPHNDVIRRSQLCATPLWSLCAIDDNLVAIVTHSAILYTFDIAENTIQSSINLGVGNKLFSVACNKNKIAVGASDVLLIVENKAVKHTKAVARKERRLPSIVWSVAFMRDNVVVSGDSRGIVSFWNAESGALLQAVESHQADVLSLCKVGDLMYASGVDPRLMAFREVSPNVFQVIKRKNGPVRDVKALVTFDGKVYASGDDYEIFVGGEGCQTVKKQWNKNIFLGNGLSFVRCFNAVDIYTTGQGEKYSDASDDINVARQPIFLARILSPSKLPIVACDVSADGKVLAISTCENTTVYRVDAKKKKNPIVRLPLRARSATALKALPDGLILAHGDFEIEKVPFDDAESEQILDQSGCGVVSQMEMSVCGKYLSVITSRSEVYVIDIQRGESRALRVELPIDLAFTDGDSLFVLTANPGFSVPETTKKILYEFPVSGGAARRSISSASLFGATGVRPLAISAGSDDRLLVSAVDGQWVIIHKSRTKVSHSSSASPSNMPCAVQFRGQNRVSYCQIEVPAPDVLPFKLKKFGTQ